MTTQAPVSRALLRYDAARMERDNQESTSGEGCSQNETTPMVKRHSFCPNCTWQKSVTSISDIEKGDHICHQMGRCPLFKHHAIVVDVSDDTLELVHFTPLDNTPFADSLSFGKKIEIKQGSKRYAEMKSLKVVMYPVRAKINKTSTIKKAQQKVKGIVKEYSLFGYNCEHLCYEITIGMERSQQVYTSGRICKLFVHYLLLIFPWIFRYLAQFLMISSHTKKESEIIARACLGVACCIFLLYCCVTCPVRSKKFFDPISCNICYKRHNKISWVRWLTFVVCLWPMLEFEIFYVKQFRKNGNDVSSKFGEWIVLGAGIFISLLVLVIIINVPKCPCFDKRMEEEENSGNQKDPSEAINTTTL